METGNRRFWAFVSIVLVSSVLIAWSLISLYKPLGYEEDYTEDEFATYDETTDEEPLQKTTESSMPKTSESIAVENK